MSSAAEPAGSASGPDAAPRETVSVVVLAYNGGDLLRRCLDRVFAQRIDAGLDVVLVDSGSTDGSEKLDEAYPVRIVRIPKEAFRYGYARNLGFARSRGRYIATISQDFVPRDETWLAALIAPLRQGYDVVQGGAQPPGGRRPFYWETRRFFFTSESRAFHRRYGGIGFSCVNLAARREVWENSGFGDETPMNEDKFFQKAAFEKGYRNFLFVPEASGWHGHQYDVRSLIRRCENEGLGWRRLGVRYSLLQMLGDLLHPKSYAKLLLGAASGKIRTPAELLFIWIRPLAVFKGNRFGRQWKR